jgi:hypothetical protein
LTLDAYADLFEDDLDAVSDRLDPHSLSCGWGDLWVKRAQDARRAPKSLDRGARAGGE